MTKFFEEFLRVSNGEFPMLKFNSAWYHSDKNTEQRTLTVRFIISTFEMKLFDEEKQKRVLEVVKSIFPGVDCKVQYIKTYADEGVVRNKIMEYFNASNQIVFRRIKNENLCISVSDSDIEVNLNFETPIFRILDASNTVDDLCDCLDVTFNQNVEVTLSEIEVDPQSVNASEEDSKIDTTMPMVGGGLRLVSVTPNEKMYGKGKVASIASLPNYICDVKSASESIVLCGKVSNMSRKAYKNKKYDPNDKKSGNPEKTLIRFNIFDTTGRMECVCFPKDEELSVFDYINDGNDVIVQGKVSPSAYNGQLSMMVNTLCKGLIDYDSIHAKVTKPIPSRYEYIYPQPYDDNEEKIVTSLIEVEEEMDKPKEEETVPAFLAGKTYVVFDLETTGLNLEKAEITDIGACKIVNGKITETFQTLVRTKEPIPEEIIEITHITNEMVASAPEIGQVLPDFVKFAGHNTLVAHNIGYDFPIISRIADAEGYVFANDLLDTLKLSQQYVTELKQHKLTVLTKHFGIEHSNAHRALADALATAEVLKIIAHRM